MRMRPAVRGVYFAAVLFLSTLFLSAAGHAGPSDAPLQTVKQRFEAGAYSSAIAALKNFLDRHPKDSGAHFWMGRCYYELRDYDNAVEQAVRAVDLAPDNSLFHQWLGRAYGGKADREHSFSLARRVKKELEKAVELDSSNASARRDLQRFYMEAPWIVGGSNAKALRMADAVAAIDPVEGHLARAEYYRQAIGNIPLAEKEYLTVLAMKLQTAGPYFEIADFYARREDVQGLEKALNAAAKAGPSDPRLSYYRGVADIIRGSSLKTAAKELQAYLETPERSEWPSHADTKEWLGRLYERESKPAAAASQYREALEKEPARSEIRARLERLERSLKQQ
jgi:tetratricopeptide (TPR) repeat protein